MTRLSFQKLSEGFFADPLYIPALEQMSLTTLDAVFAFEDAEAINPSPLPPHRSRVYFSLSDGLTVYLKRYYKPPKTEQISNWFQHRCRAASAEYDWKPTEELQQTGVSVPSTIAYGTEWDGLFEKRSFIMIREIPDGKPLEEELPPCLTDPDSSKHVHERRVFLGNLADFIRLFHDTGYRHRDLYLSHIFFDSKEQFHLIDLQRLFKPILLKERFRIKDIAQLHFSSPAEHISKTDRLRFYLRYMKKQKLTLLDRLFMKQVQIRARRMAMRDLKRGKPAPYLGLSAK